MKSAILGTLVLVGGMVVAGPTASELDTAFGVKDHVSFRQEKTGDPIVQLKNKFGQCEIMLRGAHVISCSFTGDSHPLLYVPKGGYVGIPTPTSFIHGGVPLLWPWFGSSGAPAETSWNRFKRKWLFGWGAKPAEAPFHATSRYSLFAVRSAKSDARETTVTLELTPCAEVTEWTPGDFRLEYTITLAEHRLVLSLKTTNVGKEGLFRYREGYHPYFAVSNCFKTELDGVDGCVYESSRDLPYDAEHVWHGKVPEWPGCDLFKFKEEKSTITLSDPTWRRAIVLKTTGARDVVTWCQDIKGTLKDGKQTMNILPAECNDYFCIEPSNFYAESEIALAPGQSHTFTTDISVVTR